MIRLSYKESTPKTFVPTKKVAGKTISSSGSYLLYDDGTSSAGTCIACTQKECAYYKTIDLSSPTFEAFPHNTDKRVCPTSAISFDAIGRAFISAEKCIGCGLCIHRCPTSAISLNFTSGKASINFDESLLREVTSHDQDKYLNLVPTNNIKVNCQRIPEVFFNGYEKLLSSTSKRVTDISEIVVRNTLINMGIHCNVNAAGNNHIRTEFFGEKNSLYIVGESDIVSSDTLAIPRRILDDIAVLTSRYKINKEKIISLSVINGLPNKRTDYYEVVYDISKILGIQISTITYHILWLLNFSNTILSIEDFKSFILDKKHQDLRAALIKHLPNVEAIDSCYGGHNYTPEK